MGLRVPSGRRVSAPPINGTDAIISANEEAMNKKEQDGKGSCCHAWAVGVNPNTQSVEAYAAAWNAAGRNTSAGKIKVVRCRSK